MWEGTGTGNGGEVGGGGGRWRGAPDLDLTSPYVPYRQFMRTDPKSTLISGQVPKDRRSPDLHVSGHF